MTFVFSLLSDLQEDLATQDGLVMCVPIIASTSKMNRSIGNRNTYEMI